MKTPVRSIASTLTAILVLAATPARALTYADVAGTYRGTSTATLSNGEQITAQVEVTLKPHGREIVVATVNGQTTTGTGHYRFVSDDVILGTFPTSEYTAFADLSGGTLTLTVLAKESNGEIVQEKTVVSRVQ